MQFLQQIPHFLYFGLALYFVAITAVIFALRRDLRRPIIFSGLIGIALAPIQQYICFQDWYFPKFIFGYRPDFMLGLPLPPEDILFAIGATGLAVSLYPILARKRLQPGLHAPATLLQQAAGGVIALGLLLVPFFTLGAHSALTSFMALAYLAFCFGYTRPDLIRPMLTSGTVMTCVAFVYYLVALHINPHWLQQEWFLDNLSGVMLANIPAEELAWYFFVGCAFAGLEPCRTGAGFASVRVPAHRPKRQPPAQRVRLAQNHLQPAAHA
ncbi:MAG: hypothetical protein GC129_07465 [Proteobacteria bacterium]|nr:hypothetical protein [Pseudomonadota bacterium]